MVQVAEDELAQLRARDAELQALQAMLERAKHEGGMDRLNSVKILRNTVKCADDSIRKTRKNKCRTSRSLSLLE
jgi:hypothetical protein